MSKLSRLRRLLGRDTPKPAPRRAPPPPPSPEEVVRAYHDRTKHHPQRYAASLGYLDWDHQPDPFRRWRGAPRVDLDLVPPGDSPRFEAATLEGALPPRPLDRAAISQLFMDALALSAWKQAGEARWSLRVDPSSGNLHPTEGWLVAPAVPGLSEAPAVWHYRPDLHALEERARLSPEQWQGLGLPAGSVLVALSSIWWRESWKYGERAYRYCQLDVGHCLGTVAWAAAGLGWRARLLDGVSDPRLAALLGIDREYRGQPLEERDQPEALVLLSPGEAEGLEGWRLDLAPDHLAGQPARLSEEIHAWPVIEEMHQASEKIAEAGLFDASPPPLRVADEGSDLALRRLVQQRRSAVAMDGRTGITRDAFLQICRKILPGRGQRPWTTLPWRPRVHLALFVHRVADLEPGLYWLCRDPSATDELRAMLDPAFRWRPVQDDLPLYLLQEGDLRAVAQSLSCGQDIASDGVFAAAMLGELDEALAAWGPWGWRRLHWEAGLIGQQLYLEAEATGIRATGIGCFFDDPTHQLLLRPDAWRAQQLVDLYHFTAGGPVEDTRLQTLPAYHHLARAR